MRPLRPRDHTTIRVPQKRNGHMNITIMAEKPLPRATSIHLPMRDRVRNTSTRDTVTMENMKVTSATRPTQGTQDMKDTKAMIIEPIIKRWWRTSAGGFGSRLF